MNQDFHIVFKKNKDLDNKYEFYTIFVSEKNRELKLELDDDDFSFTSGRVCKIDNNEFEKLINSSDDVMFKTKIEIDDNNDEYFSIVVDYEQLEHFISQLDLNFNLSEDKSLLFLEYLFRKFDVCNSLEIKDGNKDSFTIGIKFNNNIDGIHLRDIDFLKSVLEYYDTDYDISENEDNLSQLEDIDVNEIIADIKSCVIGQDRAVDTIVNNIYNNQMIINSEDDNFIRTAKVNILLDGPTATGKSLILHQCAKHLSLPFYKVPVTSFSTVGYRGEDLTSVLQGLLKKANGNIALAERGIVVFDEFDKLAYTGDKGLEMRNGLQHELLSYLEGETISLDMGFGNKIDFDTSKITFIALGAFNDLRERKIKANKKTSMGFNVAEEKHDNTYKISIQDYIDEGIHRELIGRFGLLASTDYLDYDKLMKILKESRISPVTALIQLGSLYGVEIVFSDEILGKIVNCALEDGTGARGLKAIVGSLQNIILADMISSKVDRIVINDEMLNKSRNFMVRGY